MIERNGMPASLEAERLVLGSLILDWEAHGALLGGLANEDFQLERHRRIMGAISRLAESNSAVDRATVYSALADAKQIEHDTLSYLVSLDEGLPQIYNLEAYVHILKEKAALRRLLAVGNAMIQRAGNPGESAEEIIEWASAQLTNVQIKPAKSAELLDCGQVIEDTGGMENFFTPGRAGRGLKTPWPGVNELTSGLHEGEVFIIAANTSMGKSSAAMQMAECAAAEGQGGAVFSLEMTRASLVDRMVCQRAKVDQQRYRKGYLGQDERLRITIAANDLSQMPLWIAEHGCATVSAIKLAIRNQRAKHPISLVVIDYLQLMRAMGRYTGRHQELSEISRSLKLLAGEEHVTVVLLSQLNRDNMREKRAPILSDLRESGAIEENADAVMFIWRPEMIHRNQPELKGVAEFIIAKQRNGPLGKVQMTWLGSLTKFESAAYADGELNE